MMEQDSNAPSPKVIVFDPGGQIPDQLREIADKVAHGERPSVTVRTLLSWFYATYRTKSTIREVERALARLAIATDPYFNWTYLDGPVTFVPAQKPPSQDGVSSSTSPVVEQGARGEAAVEHEASVSADAYIVLGSRAEVVRPDDPTYRIGRLGVANRKPVSVTPDTTIREAVTIMLHHDFSQLPVMTSEREVKGLFSWKSLGSGLSQGCMYKLVREAMDEYREISADASLFAAIDAIQERDCVLVRDSTKKITGIITPYDIGATFGQLSEPFLLLGEIEGHIRSLLRDKFTKEELESLRDPGDSSRKIECVDDLTFGEYVRLLENPDQWGKTGLQVDRVIFNRELDEVRRIRNDVMHFDPEGIDGADLKSLQDFVAFLRRLRKLRESHSEA